MADESGFPFKLQGLFKSSFSPQCRSRESLPAAPDGMEWVQNEDGKRDWRLVKISSPKEPELVTEEKAIIPVTPEAKTSSDDQLPPRGNVVDNLPAWNEAGFKEDDWELLSDRLSSSSNQTPSVIIHQSRSPHSGSIRSLSSMEGGGKILLDSLNATTLSIPFKIQRTTSNSTIDSTDNALGPLGKGVLGVDYVEHVVLPTDTLQGICLSYKISTTRLRQANCFSGNSLQLAPNKLVIPISKKALRSGFIRVQDTDAKEYKLHAMLAEFPDLSMTEAKAYV
jgi:LysM repeat protein